VLPLFYVLLLVFFFEAANVILPVPALILLSIDAFTEREQVMFSYQ
jgi:hypothetical protein